MSYSSPGEISGTGRMPWMHLAGATHSLAVPLPPCPWPPPQSRREEGGASCHLSYCRWTATSTPFQCHPGWVIFPTVLSRCQVQHLRHQIVCGKKAPSLVRRCLGTGLWKHFILPCLMVGAVLAIARLIWNQTISELSNASLLLLCSMKP